VPLKMIEVKSSSQAITLLVRELCYEEEGRDGPGISVLSLLGGEKTEPGSP